MTRDPSSFFVTEMEAFTTVSGELARNESTTVNHDYNLSLRGKLSDKTTLGYSLNYRLQRQDLPQQISTQKRTELTHDIFLGHIFNNIFRLNARVLRTDTDILNEESVEYSYSTSLKADYLKSFGQTLTYSGTHVDEEDNGTSYTNSILCID